MLRPAEDLALFRAEMAAWPGPPPRSEWQEDVAEWLDANRACHEDVLERLRADGPLPLRELPDTCVVPWRSSGWNATATSGCSSRTSSPAARWPWRPARGANGCGTSRDRVFPDTAVVPLEEARAERDRRRLRRAGHRPGPHDAAPARAERRRRRPGWRRSSRGCGATWRVDPGLLDEPFRGRTALLSPLDRLVADRKRMTELFEFDYQLEMYKPVAARRLGYWALPVLHGDALVGKVDATADRGAGVLRVAAVHWDERTAAAAEGVERELRGLARWLGLDLVLPG